MRILMISDVYFPRINGVSTSIQTFRRGLHAAGHETVLIAPQYPAGDAGQARSRIIRVPSRYLPRDPEDRIMKAGALRALRPELKRSGFDLVHIQTPFLAHYHGVSIASELGVPVDRDLSHVLRRISASLRAADSPLGDALRRASLHCFSMLSAGCAGRAVAGHAEGVGRLWRALSRCTSSPPAWRWSVSRAATAIGFANVSASRRSADAGPRRAHRA